MSRSPLPSLRAARGFSLAELLISMAIGLVILAGLSVLFMKNTEAQAEIEKAHRQVENGRYAIDVLTTDLRNAGYFAQFDPTVLASPAALPALCGEDIDALKPGLALPVQGLDNPSTEPSCIDDQRAGTDVLVVRRTRTCVAGAANCEPVSAGGPFFQASLCTNASELDSDDPANFYAMGIGTSGLGLRKRDCTSVAGSGTLAEVRRYLTHVYFIANNNQPGDGIPTLKRAELGSDDGALAYSVVPLAEGIENLQLEYGLDLAPVDGAADAFSADPAGFDGCAAAACAVENWRGVVAVKLNLLARNTVPGRTLESAERIYVLGRKADGSDNTVEPAQDSYKRHVFQAQVALSNPAGRRIP